MSSQDRLSAGCGLTLTILLLGCAAPTYIKAYPGSARALEQVALLMRADYALKFQAVDRQQIPTLVNADLATETLELLPGEHQVRLVYQAVGANYVAVSQRDQELLLPVQAGHVYLLEANLSGAGDNLSWNPTATDITSCNGEDQCRALQQARQRAEKYRNRAPSPFDLGGQAVLVNLHYLQLMAIDERPLAVWAITDYFALPLGDHTVTFRSIVRTAQAPVTLRFTIQPNRVYALTSGRGLDADPWDPAVVDVTDLLDNVYEGLRVPLQRFAQSHPQPL